MGLRYQPVTEEITPPLTPPRAHAVEQNVVQDTPSPVQKPGRSRAAARGAPLRKPPLAWEHAVELDNQNWNR